MPSKRRFCPAQVEWDHGLFFATSSHKAYGRRVGVMDDDGERKFSKAVTIGSFILLLLVTTRL